MNILVYPIMTELKVILNVSRAHELISDRDRDFMFRQIAEKYPDIPRAVVQGLEDLSASAAFTGARVDIPTVPELILRRLVQLSMGNITRLNSMIVPIVAKEPGGVGITVKFDTPVYVINSESRWSIEPANKDLFVKSLQITTGCERPAFRQLAWLPRQDPADAILVGNGPPDDPCGVYLIGPTGAPPVDCPVDEKSLSNALVTVINNDRYRSEPARQRQLEFPLTDKLRLLLATVRQHIIEQAPIRSGPVKMDFLVSLEKSLHCKFSLEYSTNLSASLFQKGLGGLYQRALIKGERDVEVLQALESFQERTKKAAHAAVVRQKMDVDANVVAMYLKIIETKLGPKVAAKVRGKIAAKQSLVSPKGIIGLLSANEARVVAATYDAHKKYIEAVTNNKCEHVRTYRQFRSAVSGDRIKTAFTALSKFFAKAVSGGFIVCNKCGFNILCPHVKIYTELENQGKPYAEIHAKMSGFIAHGLPGPVSYCKICGEALVDEGILTVRDASIDIPEELRNLIYGEIMGAIRNLKFTTIVPIPTLVDAIRSNIYPYIADLEKQFLRSRTNSAEETKAKERLFTSIYTYAYIINFIRSNPGVNFKSLDSKVAKHGDKDFIKQLVIHALTAIISAKNIIIREIPGMTGDIIKAKLIEAYRLISGQGSAKIAYAEESEDITTTISMDPVYHYLAYIHGLATKWPNAKGPAKAGVNLKLLGVSKAAELTGIGDLYSKAVVPSLSGKGAHAQYVKKSFELFWQMVSTRMYDKPMYIDVTPSHDKPLDGPKIIMLKITKEYEDYAKAAAELLALEAQLRAPRDRAVAFNVMRVKWPRRPTGPPATLRDIYDEDGAEHRFTILIVDGKETSTAEIARGLEAGTKWEGVITDRRCVVCGTLKSELNILDEKVIAETLETKNNIANFFRFYEHRCPDGGIHAFTDEKCTKCGITINMSMNVNSKEAMTFYRRWRKTYEVDKVIKTDLTFAAPLPPKEFPALEKELAKWSTNFNVVQQLANELKINYRLLVSLGSFEGKKYEDIASGLIVPAPSEHKNDTRAFTCDGHVITFLTMWNQVRYSGAGPAKQPWWLSTLLADSGVISGGKLLSVGDGYNDKFRFFMAKKKPQDVIDFCIEELCRMALLLYTHNDPPTATLRRSFVRLVIVDKILAGEIKRTKHDYFNWAILYPETAIHDKSPSAAAVEGDDAVSETPDEPEEEEDETGFAGLRELDRDDMEGDIEGDESNQVRVEGYGTD